MRIITLLIVLVVFSFTTSAQSQWDNIVVTEDTEVFIDSTDIKRIDGKIYTYIKTVYVTDRSKQAYLNKIKGIFKKKDAEKKIRKWDDFSYTETYGIYDCLNKRFKILQVTDYTSTGKQIIRTKTKNEKSPWLLVDSDTVGDFTLFYICDYGN